MENNNDSNTNASAKKMNPDHHEIANTNSWFKKYESFFPVKIKIIDAVDRRTN